MSINSSYGLHGQDLACIFECGDPLDESMFTVEMNVDSLGKFLAHQNHSEFPHAGEPVAGERVAGLAHHRCYKRWYEQTYKSPFTMSA